MGWISGTVVFLLIWWVIFFMTLPLRVERQQSDINGIDPGAPKEHHLKFKFFLTTGITTALWMIYYALIEYGVLTHAFFE